MGGGVDCLMVAEKDILFTPNFRKIRICNCFRECEVLSNFSPLDRLPTVYFLVVHYLAYILALKMEAVRSSEQSEYLSRCSNGLQARRSGFDSRHGKMFLYFIEPRPARGPADLLYNGYQRLFPQG
jgi:hypothetical protein